MKLSDFTVKNLNIVFLILDRWAYPENKTDLRAYLGQHPRRKILLFSTLLGLILLFVASRSTGGQVRLAFAAGFMAEPVNCTDPFAKGGGNLWDDLPPLLDPSQWIGYVFAQLCKAVATTFFTVANYAVQWGSGCNSTGGAGLDFFRHTPTTIWIDASRSDWTYYFYDGQFIGVAILVQFLWMASTFLWQSKIGSGNQGLEPSSIITRAFLGIVLTTFSASLLEWSLELCNDFNSLFTDQLTIFQANSFQVDKGGNIFNTILAIVAAAVAILLVMQMATRYIYIAFLGFIFPVSGILWTNPGTQGYARLFFGSWFATVFVQPLQLGVLYITSAMKDGARLDASMAMLFGICGSFLALGIPRIVNSVLGGNIPLNGRGLLVASTLVARRAIRAGNSLVTVSNSNGGGGPASGYYAPHNPGNGGSGGGGARLNPTPANNVATYGSGSNTTLRGSGVTPANNPSTASQVSSNTTGSAQTGGAINTPTSGQSLTTVNSSSTYIGNNFVSPASTTPASINSGPNPSVNTNPANSAPLHSTPQTPASTGMDNSGLTITLTRNPSNSGSGHVQQKDNET